MIQGLFFILFMMSLFVGFFIYYKPAYKTLDLESVMQQNGYNPMEESDTARSEQLNVKMSAGLMKVQTQTDAMATGQGVLLRSIEDQQRILDNTHQEIARIMGQLNGKDSKDFLKLKALGIQLEDQQRLLVARGQELIALNDQLALDRKHIADQVYLFNMDSAASIGKSSGRSYELQQQAKGLTYQGAAHCRNDPANDTRQKSEDLIDEENQKAQYQQEMIQQRIADQEQRAADQRNQ